MLKVEDIRQHFIGELMDSNFVTDKTGVKTIEMIGATFEADEPTIFGELNEDYIQRELEWYKSMSLYVDDIPGITPAIWQQVADRGGKINSNYGWCIWSNKNYDQYENVLKELRVNPDSRRATMIYNRPSMHYDFNRDGMNDFMCTFANSFFIRDGKLVSHYIMRSNDSVFGYGNDYAWAKHIQEKLANALNVEVGDLIWTASNLHVYERHFKFVEELNV